MDNFCEKTIPQGQINSYLIGKPMIRKAIRDEGIELGEILNFSERTYGSSGGFGLRASGRIVLCLRGDSWVKFIETTEDFAQYDILEQSSLNSSGDSASTY